MLPAPLLAAKLASLATIGPMIHPGDAAPEPRYIPVAGSGHFRAVPRYDMPVPRL